MSSLPAPEAFQLEIIDVPKREHYAGIYLDPLLTTEARQGFIDQREEDQRRLFTSLQSAFMKEVEIAELKHELAHDSLTGLYNRKAFEGEIDRRIAQSVEDDSVFAVLFLDMDGFKDINDTFGHAIGDAALNTMAGTLRTNTRHDYKTHASTDSLARMGPEETAAGESARFGGDEFGVVIQLNKQLAESGEMSYEQQVGAFTTRVRQEYTVNLYDKHPEIEQLEKRDIVVGVSVGFAIFNPGDTAPELLTTADKAMYEDKRERKLNSPGSSR